MTMGEEKRASLKYRLLGMQEDVGSWGHEYVRHLSGASTVVRARGISLRSKMEWQRLA